MKETGWGIPVTEIIFGVKEPTFRDVRGAKEAQGAGVFSKGHARWNRKAIRSRVGSFQRGNGAGSLRTIRAHEGASQRL